MHVMAVDFNIRTRQLHKTPIPNQVCSHWEEKKNENICQPNIDEDSRIGSN